MKEFKLTPRRYPIPIGFMGRKQSTDFNDTTLETWKKFIPEDFYEIRTSDKEIIIHNTVKIQYGGFDSEDTVKKFNSAEYGFGFIDQAEEVSQDDYGTFKGTLRLKIGDTPLRYKTLLTANPAPCWLKDEFITQQSRGNEFIQALPTDNPFLPPDYVDTLTDAFKHRPELLEAYLHGNWDTLGSGKIVIKPIWVQASINRVLKENFKRRVISCDPARFGEDETVIYVFEDGKIIDSMIYGQRDTMQTAGNLVVFKNKYKAEFIAVDSTGVGSGVVDRLRELREPVIDVNFGSKATTEPKQKKFYNRRAQIWWEAGEMFANEEVSIPDDRDLRTQLVNCEYEVSSSGKIKLESKADIKKRMSGRSPDRGDAFVLGLHALQFCKKNANDYKRNVHIDIPDNKNDYGWSYHKDTIL